MLIWILLSVGLVVLFIIAVTTNRQYRKSRGSGEPHAKSHRGKGARNHRGRGRG